MSRGTAGQLPVYSSRFEDLYRNRNKLMRGSATRHNSTPPLTTLRILAQASFDAEQDNILNIDKKTKQYNPAYLYALEQAEDEKNNLLVSIMKDAEKLLGLMGMHKLDIPRAIKVIDTGVDEKDTKYNIKFLETSEGRFYFSLSYLCKYNCWPGETTWPHKNDPLFAPPLVPGGWRYAPEAAYDSQNQKLIRQSLGR